MHKLEGYLITQGIAWQDNKQETQRKLTLLVLFIA
jgi:hypothetical protein